MVGEPLSLRVDTVDTPQGSCYQQCCPEARFCSRFCAPAAPAAWTWGGRGTALGWGHSARHIPLPLPTSNTTPPHQPGRQQPGGCPPRSGRVQAWGKRGDRQCIGCRDPRDAAEGRAQRTVPRSAGRGLARLSRSGPQAELGQGPTFPGTRQQSPVLVTVAQGPLGENVGPPSCRGRWRIGPCHPRTLR